MPLTEMAVRTVIIRQCFADSFSASYKELLFGQMGSASFTLNGDYYNRYKMVLFCVLSLTVWYFCSIFEPLILINS